MSDQVDYSRGFKAGDYCYLLPWGPRNPGKTPAVIVRVPRRPFARFTVREINKKIGTEVHGDLLLPMSIVEQAALMEARWFVYMVQCADGMIYTGVTTDVKRRIKAHEAGKGAKYTRGRGPFQLLYTEACETKHAACKREWNIKCMKREQKLALVEQANKPL